MTLAADFTQQVLSVDANGDPVFGVTGGTASVYFDTTPDYNFAADSGFTNGAAIPSGVVSGGTGTLLPSVGLGVTGLNLVINGLNYNQSVFSPQTIGGGSTLFTLQINTAGTPGTVSSVLGTAITGGTVLDADGSLTLQAVPLPPAVWLLTSALLGLGAVGRRPV